MSDEKVYSKLGKVYPKREIERLDKKMHKRLAEMRASGPNSRCAECRDALTNWASVSLGVFVCTECAQIHRALGAHISKVKSCMGTYLWCPDEIAAMEAMGNARAEEVYGVAPPPSRPFDRSMGGAMFTTAQNRYEKGLYRQAQRRSVPAAVKGSVCSGAAVPPPAAVTTAVKPKSGWEWDDLDF